MLAALIGRSMYFTVAFESVPKCGCDKNRGGGDKNRISFYPFVKIYIGLALPSVHATMVLLKHINVVYARKFINLDA